MNFQIRTKFLNLIFIGDDHSAAYVKIHDFKCTVKIQVYPTYYIIELPKKLTFSYKFRNSNLTNLTSFQGLALLSNHEFVFRINSSLKLNDGGYLSVIGLNFKMFIQAVA